MDTDATEGTDRPTNTSNRTCCNMCCKIYCNTLKKFLRFVILFAYPSLGVKESEDGELTLLGAKVKNACGKAWVYAYFVISLAIGLAWSIALFCDQVFYIKFTSCNDIKENDTSLVCFNLKDSGPDLPYGKRVDCTTQSPEAVLCYLSHFSPFITFGAATGFLIGYLAAQRILAHVFVFLTQQNISCLRYTALSLQICLLLLFLGSAFTFPMLGRLNDDWKYDPFLNFFFYGSQPTKIAMFVCFVLTFLWSGLMPWYVLVGTKNARQKLSRRARQNIYK